LIGRYGITCDDSELGMATPVDLEILEMELCGLWQWFHRMLDREIGQKGCIGQGWRSHACSIHHRERGCLCRIGSTKENVFGIEVL
jgi:hypothetical protein